MKNDPHDHVSWSSASSTMPRAAALLEHRGAGVRERHARAERHPEPVGQRGIRDRPAEVGDLELEEHVEHDVAVGALEPGVPVAEAAVAR